MSYENLLFEVQGAVARITLNRPAAANALDLAMARELEDAARRCEQGPGVRAVLLTGAGRFFCGGGDLAGFAGAGEGVYDYLRATADALHAAIARLARMDAPVIAAVNGPAAGAGMSLACMADFALAAESAVFTMAYTAAGLTPDGSSTWFLPRSIGVRRAKELMLTNRRLSAAEALAWDLVSRVVPDPELLPEAEKLARELAAGPTAAFGRTKRLLLRQATSELAPQLDAESEAIAESGRCADGREGVAAFLAKRRPRFSGS
jgi:2-(1,2-epoxy-1,2-dihydrophenyl)acetyl-CoA isomerase